jgi:hypothetical protein
MSSGPENPALAVLSGPIGAQNRPSSIHPDGSHDRNEPDRPTVHHCSGALLNSLISPWHQWLDPARYRAHLDSVADLHPDTVATAHGPLLAGMVLVVLAVVRLADNR